MKKHVLGLLAGMLLAFFCIPEVMPAAAAGLMLKGDVDGSGVFDASDVHLLHRWLTGRPETVLSNPAAADYNGDGILDAADLSCMKRALHAPQDSEVLADTGRLAAAFICSEDHELLYGDRIHDRIKPASLTKLLTASVALQYIEPDTVVTVGTELSLVKPNSSLCYIRKGEQLRFFDLLTGMLMASGNDAAYTVAVTTARIAYPGLEMDDATAVSYFTDMMNSLAAMLGMGSSHFVNPEGWEHADHYTTVADLITLADYAFSLPIIRQITGVHEKTVTFETGEVAEWTNTNRLLDPDSPFYCPDAFGIKTGTTSKAGCCIIGAFSRGGKTYISAVVGCKTNIDRYQLTLEMLNQFT